MVWNWSHITTKVGLSWKIKQTHDNNNNRDSEDKESPGRDGVVSEWILNAIVWTVEAADIRSDNSGQIEYCNGKNHWEKKWIHVSKIADSVPNAVLGLGRVVKSSTSHELLKN